MFTYPMAFARLANFMGSADGFNEATKEAFEEKTRRDFNTLKDWFPRNTLSVLDIGCGLGSVNILIARKKDVENINIIEGEGTENKRTSFHDNIKAWADRELARDFIQANVPGKCAVVPYPPDPELTILADLIISFKSWGHHYPVGIYIDLVKRSLKPGGRVVMDIRKGRGDGLKAMQENGFRPIGRTYESPKCERTVFER